MSVMFSCLLNVYDLIVNSHVVIVWLYFCYKIYQTIVRSYYMKNQTTSSLMSVLLQHFSFIFIKKKPTTFLSLTNCFETTSWSLISFLNIWLTRQGMTTKCNKYINHTLIHDIRMNDVERFSSGKRSQPR